ncbi:hypothetical protein OC834_002549 [Tilletia horrida]|nr:hypothetical protein OC834_002549 [Tilletia horrida]
MATDHNHAVHVLALNCGSSSLKLKLFSLHIDELISTTHPPSAASASASASLSSSSSSSRHHLRRLSSASSLSGVHYPASVDLPQGLELLIAASVNLKGEDDKRTAVLKWGKLPQGTAAVTHDKITLKHTEIATEPFLQEVLDILATALPTSRSSAAAISAPQNLRSTIRFITHRVVHGAAFPQPYILRHDSDEAEHIRALESLEALAPLHNVVSTRVIKLCLRMLPQATNLCLWDTAFHWTIPEEVRTYAVWQPSAVHLPGGMELRKWGFHGLSYSSVLRQVSAFLERPTPSLNLIIAHLGSGASICAIRAGKSLDTTMGLTPLEGLPGSTRSGSVDPALSHHLKPDPARHGTSPIALDLSEQARVTVPGGDDGIQLDWAEWELNSKSGWLAIAGVRDFEEIVARKDGRVPPELCSDDDRRRAKLAFDLFLDRIVAYVGAYYFKILAAGATHIDALVFSGGIGEHSSELRMALAAKLEHSPLALRNADGGHFGSDKVGGVYRILGPAKDDRSMLGRWPSGMLEDVGTSSNSSSSSINTASVGNKQGHGLVTPGSPLGPGPMSIPGSPRASHSMASHSMACSGRWGVPWLVCETDEELECVRLAMPTIRNYALSAMETAMEHEQST